MPSLHPLIPPQAARRSGFSFVELLVAITVAGAVMAIAYPKMGPIRDSAAVRSSRQLVAMNLATARQAAIRRGVSATFHIDGNTTWVSMNGGADTIAAKRNVQEEYRVTLSSPMTTVTYNPRGIARVTSTNRYIRLTRGSAKDSVCVGLLGALGKCGL